MTGELSLYSHQVLNSDVQTPNAGLAVFRKHFVASGCWKEKEVRPSNEQRCGLEVLGDLPDSFYIIWLCQEKLTRFSLISNPNVGFIIIPSQKVALGRVDRWLKYAILRGLVNLTFSQR